jgi:hypothetical protein
VIHSNPFLDHVLRILIQLNRVVLTYNFDIVDRMLIINESSLGAFLLIALYLIYRVITFTLFIVLLPLHYLPCYYLYISFISCTC